MSGGDTPRRGTTPGGKTKRPPVARPPEPVDWWDVATAVAVVFWCAVAAAIEMGWI